MLYIAKALQNFASFEYNAYLWKYLEKCEHVQYKSWRQLFVVTTLTNEKRLSEVEGNELKSLHKHICKTSQEEFCQYVKHLNLSKKVIIRGKCILRNMNHISLLMCCNEERFCRMKLWHNFKMYKIHTKA